MAVSLGLGSNSEPELKKFQGLLRTLFQFDCADLDFGIYRILNYKREQVETFITKRLPQIMNEAFSQYATAEKTTFEQELDQLRQRIEESGKALGQAPFDEKGRLKEAFQGGELGKRYLQVLEKVQSIQVTEELKARVYNDLYTFFSRYYEDGDFISKRRYGRGEAYAIPYNGEEVALYWANKDQYYVKSSEHFRTYRFKVGDYTIAFELRNASTEQNNKGERRYFVLAGQNPIAWDEKNRTLTLFLEYRPLTSEEQEQYGKTEQQKPQDKLNEQAVSKVLDWMPEPALKFHLAKPESNGQPLLLKHLTRFTRKNTSDFFIHKDLKSFLLRELDFFIKNEVLLLDELIAGKVQDLDCHVRRARVVRDIGEKIIDFLAQVEDFQKKLWEKKKFVVRTEYCVTLDRVPEELWDEVLANEWQIEEWRKLYALDELLERQGLMNTSLSKDFLRAHPTLVVDTRHFSEDFKWRLLASFDDLDEALDGVLIKSENWQALNTILPKFRRRVKCVHIDPPYNTDASGFLYKNAYRNSSWLSMMLDRILASKDFMSADGTFLCHIDENEYEHLSLLLKHLFGYVCTAIWDKLNPMMGAKGLAIQHEYILMCGPEARAFAIRSENVRSILSKAREITDKHGGVTELAKKEFNEWVRRKEGLTGGERAYQFLDDSGHVYRLVAMTWPNPKPPPPEFFEPLIHPITKKPCPVPSRGWSLSPEKMKELLARGEIVFGPDETTQPQRKVYLTESKALSSIIREGSRGKKELEDLGLDFTYSHPVSLYVTLLDAGLDTEANGAVVLDFFAGSGTTAHAVINLNRQDGGRRKYILVEMAEYFDTVLLPRIKKVVFCEKWKDGKPIGGEGTSHFLKYNYLEQYEDTLTNLELRREQEGQLALKMFGDEYLLKYVLDFETQGSPSLLNLEMFKDPFAYRLKVQEGDGVVERNVDLVETFNYLLGIDVKKMRVFDKDGRTYRAVLGEKKGKHIAIVWRSVADIEEDKEKLMADKTFIEGTVLPALVGEGAKPDRLLVNGPCYAEDAEAIEPEFKRLMFSGVA